MKQLGVEEYLDLVFDDRPEPDYVDGEVVERALPTPIHSRIQALLILLFAPRVGRFRLVLQPELRVRVEPRRFRVVDLAVYRDSQPEGRYATTPRLSPSKSFRRMTATADSRTVWKITGAGVYRMYG